MQPYKTQLTGDLAFGHETLSTLAFLRRWRKYCKHNSQRQSGVLRYYQQSALSKHPCPIDIVRGGEDIVNTARDPRGAQECNIATQSDVFLLQGDRLSLEREQDMLRCFFFEVRELLNLREKGQKWLQMLYKHILHPAPCLSCLIKWYWSGNLVHGCTIAHIAPMEV